MKTPTRPAPHHPQASKAPGPAGTPFEQLDAVLRALLAEHEKLLALAGDHGRAIAQADAAALSTVLIAQSAAVSRISMLERQRQSIVGEIIRSSGIKPTAKGATGPTMSEVAAHAPEPLRSHLASVAAALRELLNKLHREHLAIRKAAEMLSMHMEGLMRQVCRGLSHTGTYARCGSIDSSVQVVSAVDVRS